MSEKTCSACRELKPSDLFNKKGDGLSSKCKACNAAYLKIHYQKNKLYYRSKADRYERDLRDEIAAYKAARGCSRCPERHEACLDFHHVDEKIESISSLIASCSRTMIYDEIQKCILLCSNCHRKLHWRERHGISEP